MKFYSGLALIVFSSSLHAANLPNYRFEEGLERTYESLAEPMSEDQWNDILSQGGSPENYEIRSGDNLWDVSKTIFGTGFFWPKLWQLNSEITNPHDIKPGARLSFLDQGLQAPVLVQADQSQQIEEAPKQTAEAPTADEELEMTEDELLELKWVEPELPPGKAVRRVMSEIPPSFFDWRGETDKLPDVEKIESKKAGIYNKQKYFAHHFVTQSKLESVGVVQNTDTSFTKTAGFYEYIFVKLDSAEIGEEFLALYETDEIEFLKKDTEKKARAVEIQGRIKIVSLVDDAKGIYKALIIKSFRPIDIGAKLVRRDYFTTDWNTAGEYADIRANIFGGRYDDGRKIMGLGSIVYLDEGQSSGLAEGLLLNVLRNNVVRNIPAGVKDSPRIGRLKIIHADANVSTAIVVDSIEEVRPGDFTGNPVQVQIGQ